jgi:hypothetical protein
MLMTLGACSLAISLDGFVGGAANVADARDEASSEQDARLEDSARVDVDVPTADGANEASPDSGQADGCYLADGLSPGDQSTSDGVSYEMGTRVRPTVAVVATKMRFWRSPAETTLNHVGSLWSAQGAKLSEVTLPTTTAVGWVEGTFPAPVPLVAGEDYVVSVVVAAYYASTTSLLASKDRVCPNGKLVATASTNTKPNGLFGAPGTLPTNSFQGTYYFVDLHVE